MKKVFTIFAVIVSLAVFQVYIHADTGPGDATRIERGSHFESGNVAVTTHTATAIFNNSFKRPDIMFKNFSSYTVYVGSWTTSADLFSYGYPLGSSETFRVDGNFIGSINGAVDGGAAGNVNIRWIAGMVY